MSAFLVVTVPSNALAQDVTSDPLVENVSGPPIQFSTAKQSLASSQIQIFNGRSPDKGDWTSIAIASSKTGTATRGPARQPWSAETSSSPPRTA
ncbi:hypothetical protein [Sphingomonas sp. Ant20]|uniref:hypothetical protein n=1 Tax=Sphingomonas sp. Ant20 TaxID=104605 RepID=UPI0005371E93|nr:hypothetical protein [Sphingomonas sp. Ant20]KHA64298.1 hypothetical protein NI18_09935 [Sphingomonas sp. Ant20]